MTAYQASVGFEWRPAEGWEISVDAGPGAAQDFHEAHHRRYGWSDDERFLGELGYQD